MPNVVAVQSENSAPIYQAFLEGKTDPVSVKVRPTAAEGIAIGVPMRGRQILGLIYKYGFKVITAPESEISSVRSALAAKGIYCEHTAAAACAGWKHYCKRYGRGIH